MSQELELHQIGMFVVSKRRRLEADYSDSYHC
jgi:hypothetical protein